MTANRTEHTCYKSIDGTLTTSLAEDVISLIETQRSVLWDYLNEAELVGSDVGHEIFQEGTMFVMSCLKESQVRNRLVFLTTIEDACAAANDFFRMSERIENFVRELYQNHFLLSAVASVKQSRQAPEFETEITPLQQLGDSLVDLFSQDAVYGAERAQVFILRTVQEQTSIPSDLFSTAWELDWTHNEVANKLVKVFSDCLVYVRRFLSNDYLYHKSLIISARAMVCFYIRCLVQKAEAVSWSWHRPGAKPFQCTHRALIRMMDDMCAMTDFFEEEAKGNQALMRMIRTEFGTLEVIYECLKAADDPASLESFIVVIHKRTGADALVTRHLVADLCLLARQDIHKDRKGLKHTLEQLQPDLHMVTTRMKDHRPASKTDKEISFVRLDEMLKVLYEDRIAQGLLPVCWTCLPKDVVQDSDESVLAGRIRSLTRNVAELRFGKKKAPSSTKC